MKIDEDDERIQVLTNVAQDLYDKHYLRFDRWGASTSIILLEALEKLGYTITKKEHREDVSDMRESET